MNLTNDTKNKHKELVRQVLALQPRATLTEIQETLKANKVDLNIQYIGKLREKVRAERIIRFDTAKVNARISEMQDKFEELEKHLWKIVIDPRTSTQQKINAAVAIVKTEKELLDAQMDAGVFERKLGTLEAKFGVNLDDPQRQSIINAFRNYGIITDAVVVENKELSDGANTNNTTQ